MTTLSPFLDRKLARRFRTYDTDGTGYLDRSDFAGAATRMSDEFGLAMDDPARERLIDLCVGMWDHLLAADSDGDGRVTEAEYKSAFARGLLETEESFDAGYVPFLEAIMDVADTDGDGRLTVEDHIRWTGSLMNLPEADAREVHHRLDSDGDGFITTDDLLSAIRAYYFDDTPDSPGSWLLGPLDS